MYESSSRVFSQPDVSRWVGQAAAALQYMHDQRILHRDLSTSNLLLNKDDDVLITDFGLSCTLKRGALERSTELQSKVGGSGDSDLQRTLLAKTTCGTPKCMSPELVEGKGYSTTGRVPCVVAAGCRHLCRAKGVDCLPYCTYFTCP